jgi:hypothetical protein
MRGGRFGSDALRTRAYLPKHHGAVYLGAASPKEADVMVMSVCGRAVDVAFSTMSPLDVTCAYCKKQPAFVDARKQEERKG